jgi:hypothetical protein
MGFQIDDLIRLQPFAYHSTCRENFESICRSKKPLSAASFLRGTEYESHLEVRRTRRLTVEANDGCTVIVQDNLPFRPGSVDFQNGWTEERWFRELNSRVFLWPGSESGPIIRGVSHYKKYHKAGEVFVIRKNLSSLVDVNSDQRLYVSKCNSGSTHHNCGRPAPRGPETFQSLSRADFTPGKVVEITYCDEAALPDDAQWSVTLHGPWKSLGTSRID